MAASAAVFDKKDAVNFVMKQQQHHQHQSMQTNLCLVGDASSSLSHQNNNDNTIQCRNNNIKDNLKNFSLKPDINHLMSSTLIDKNLPRQTYNKVNNADFKENCLKPGANCLSNLKSSISETSKKKIADIITDIGKFNDIEKLYLYLQLPDGSSNNEDSNDVNKKKNVSSPFGKKADSEVIQTYAWIQSHLEEDISVSIPKHEVYEEYKTYCEANKFEKLCVADFGKAMKHIFPHVKPRRLGQRGNSKYCYSGLRKKILLNSPELPLIHVNEYGFCQDEIENNQKKNNVMVNDIVWNVILEWVEKNFNRKFKTSIDFARYLIETENIKSEMANSLHSDNNHMNGSSLSRSPYNIGAASVSSILSQMTTKAYISKSSNYGKKDGNPSKSHQSKLIENNKKTNNVSNNSNNKVMMQHSNKISSISNFNSVICNGRPTVHLLPNDLITNTTNANILCNGSSNNCIAKNADNEMVLADSKMVKIWPGNQQQQTIIANNSDLSSGVTFVAHPQKTGLENGNTSGVKYKSIQPKPVNFGASDEKAVHFDCVPDSNDACSNQVQQDKRRHSLTTLSFNVNRVKKELPDDELNSLPNSDYNKQQQQLNEIDKNYKRQMDEEFNFMAKKRHVENSSDVQQQPGNSYSNSATVSIVNSKYNALADIGDLKVNELENEALNEYLNTNSNVNFSDNLNDCNNGQKTDNFVQIRKLLENHLAKPPNTIHQRNNFNQSEIFKTSKVTDGSKSSLHSLLSSFPSKENNNVIGSDFLGQTSVNHPIQNVSSPGSHGSAFSFQPISPRNTPTIPENSALEMNNVHTNKMNFNPMSYKQTTSVSTGPSQPSSEANSPFVSPRTTPISSGRSRNNSGQSVYSSYRQTPSMQNFDSGVSSISSSPFISPQSTPIPTSRMRPLDNLSNNMSRNATSRVRHSSGPGGPVNRSQMTSLMAYNRSNSLSPMIINENGNVFANNQSYVQSPFNLMDSNVQSSTAIENNVQQKLSVVTQTDNTKERISADLFFNFQTDSNHMIKSASRQRHFSNPYGGVSTPMVKSDDRSDFKSLLNRSQSVPLHQMFESNTFEPLATKTSMNNFNADLLQQNESSLMPLLGTDTSKSFTSTPICNESFKLSTEMSNVGTSNMVMNEMITSTLDDLLTNTDNVIQSGQDLIVSSVHINSNVPNDINTDSNQRSTVDDLNVPSPLILKDGDRNEFNDLLINDRDVEQFQSLDAFQDCDNDFSNIGLDHNVNVYDGDFSG